MPACAKADASKSGGSRSEKWDDFDSVERSIHNSIRRQEEQNRTYGLGADEVARYRTQTELLTAAKRAEELRENSHRTDQYRDMGADGVRTLVRGLSEGASAGRTLENVLSNIKNRVSDLAANSISDMLFGKRGTGDYGLFSSFLGGGNAANAPASGAQGLTAQASGLSSLLASAKSFFRFADGGHVRGLGGPKSDSIPAWLSDGEYVVQASSVSRYGKHFFDSLNNGTAKYLADGGFLEPRGGRGGLVAGCIGEAPVLVVRAS